MTAAPTQLTEHRPLRVASVTWLIAMAGSFATAIGILIGWLYHVGFLDGFDVPADLFPQPVQALLLNCYTAAVSIYLRLLPGLEGRAPVIAAIAIGIALVILLYSILMSAVIGWAARQDDLRRRGAEWIERSRNRSSHVAIAKAAFAGGLFFTLPYVVASVLALFVVPPLIGFLAGKWEAERLLRDQRCRNDQGALMKSCVELQFDDGSRVTGFYIASSDSAVAIRAGSQTLIYRKTPALLVMGSAKR